MLKRILLPIDPTTAEAWQPAIDAAVDLARKYAATIAVVWVAPPVGSDPVSFADVHMPALEAVVGERLPSDVATELHLRADWGDPDREICNAAKELGADLIVMGTHGPHAGETVEESNAATVVLHAECSVYVVR
jgi:nucleotide-binding universal stress UspA family protein